MPPAMFLEQILAHLRGERRWGDGVMRDLDVSPRDQGPVRSVEEMLFRRCSLFASVARVVSGAASGLGGGLLALWFATGQEIASGSTFASSWNTDVGLWLRILNKHSTDRSLVEVLRRHYVADHLFSDAHQEKPLFRWCQRYSYVDSAFMERLKEELTEIVKKKVMEREEESEANNTDAGAESSANAGLFEEDPLACILGTPDSNSKMNTGTILMRPELRIEKVTGIYVSHILKTVPVSDMLEIAAAL